MEHTEPPDKPVGYWHVHALVRNLDDPKAAVRIASLRAATRLAGLEDGVSPRARETMLTNVERRPGSYRPEDILGVSAGAGGEGGNRRAAFPPRDHRPRPRLLCPHRGRQEDNRRRTDRRLDPRTVR